jgi:L-alanine-DL-glutamate epimerase-like enolase superfamily enzyme
LLKAIPSAHANVDGFREPGPEFTMTFTLQETHFHVLPMHARFPFKYGIASMTALPHLFVTVNLTVAGQSVQGLASEGLPPKWFTKNPTTLFEQDLAEMLAVIQNASRIAHNAAQKPVSFFAWWKDLYDEQKRWASIKEVPSLLANLGVSLIERAVLDGLCKAAGHPLHRLLASDFLAIDLGAVREELKGITVAQTLAPQPLASIAARHTVGLGDPLRSSDIPVEEQLHDGLPHALDESIRAYGLTYFKIKVCGKPEIDLPRLREITAVITAGCPRGFHATLDGNEQFEDLATFRDFYESLRAEPALAPLFQNLLLIEQPLHRNHALKDDVGAALATWSDGPGLIIDEADGSLDDLPRALDLGYSGTSHKNCKGIVKGLANAALLKVRAPTMKRPPILSGEDLANVGPIALLQDLAVMAALGVIHVERNGHHYFRGLSMFPQAVQDQMLAAHPDLYHQTNAGVPSHHRQHRPLRLRRSH